MARTIRGLAGLAGLAVVAGGALSAGYVGLVTGACPADLGVGRRTRPLGPQEVEVVAPRETVFDVIVQPYLGRATRAMAAKVQVLERGSDMVLAAHFTPAGHGLTAKTVETVRFARPERVDFRLVRGPVPHVTEVFELAETAAGTRLSYRGEMGADLWAAGQWWARRVAGAWEAAVAASLSSIKAESERRAGRR